MAVTRKEYWEEVRSVYKDPKDYVLAGKGNAYVRIDAEAKVKALPYIRMTYIFRRPGTASWCILLMHMPSLKALILQRLPRCRG